MFPVLIYKIVSRSLWRQAEESGIFSGSAVDHADGFIHFSTASQVEETARRHYAGEADLLLVTVETAKLGTALRWEPARGGMLFPHLYAPLGLEAVHAVQPLPLGPEGLHLFPALEG